MPLPSKPRFSAKQIKFYNESHSRLNIASGSVSSGKSHIVDFRYMEEIKDGPQGDYLITGKNEDTVNRNVVQEMVKFTGGLVRFRSGAGEFELFGRKVYVIGANDERAETKIRGATFAGALVDEMTVLPSGYIKMLLTRLRVPGAKLFGTTNPDSPIHWLKTDILDKFANDPKQLYHLHFNLDDNPGLDDDYKESLKKTFSGLFYRRFILGEWVLAEGSVYDFFDTNIHVVNTPPTYAKQYFLGVDYGTSNPFAAVLVGYNDDIRPSLWVEKEFYWNPKKEGFQKTDAEFQLDLRREFGDYPVRQIISDPSAASFEVELRRHKWPVRQANNDVLPGIRFVSTLISQGNLVICKNCTNLIKEFEGYVWDSKRTEKGEDKPLKQSDHALDALRYVLYTQFGMKHTLKETTTPPQPKPWNPSQSGWQII